MSNSNKEKEESKEFKICNVLGGLDITRLVSTNTRSFFGSAIEDVELMREFVTEAARYEGLAQGFSNLDALSQSLDWEARDLPPGTTTVEAGLGYVDDRIDRRMERSNSLFNPPLAGTQQSDMAFIDSMSLLLPWIVDRKSREKSWWKSHQVGRSEGTRKEPLPFDSMYTAGWILTWSEATGYYPPLNVYGHPLTLGDMVGAPWNSHGEQFVTPSLPQNNPDRLATFTEPYPDLAIPGLSLITATAPIYLTANPTFQDQVYNDTYVAAVGVDIAIGAISSSLDVLQDSLTPSSFGLLVDFSFDIIVISQHVVRKLYPQTTGFEDSRVTYDEVDGATIVQDRRNQTYLPSDTILQDLTKLDNADWKGLLTKVQTTTPGDRNYASLNVTLTGAVFPTEFYVFFERWKYVADWNLLVFVPVAELEKAVDVYTYQPTVLLEGERGLSLSAEGSIVNNGNLDVLVTPKEIPSWISLTGNTTTQIGESYTLRSGESLQLNYQVLTEELEIGKQSSSLIFDVQDADYPDCFFNKDVSLPVSVKVLPKDCGSGRVPDVEGNCVCASNHAEIGSQCVSYAILLTCILVPIFVVLLFLVYLHGVRKNKKADSVWEVHPSELKFGDPAKVIGEGRFGEVILAEYRGTQVAVKRVIANGSGGLKNNKKGYRSTEEGYRTTEESAGKESADSMLEAGLAQEQSLDKEGTMSGSASTRTPPRTINLKNGPGMVSALGHASTMGSKSQKTTRSRMGSVAFSPKSTDKQRQDFIEEMRLISKLRHPCITTVMGAVVARSHEPMLVMEYMENGSLYDLLHNNIELEGDVMLPLLRDMTQGIQFLHNTTPPVIHGDLKSANILVDIRFRAKVTDFGLSQGSKGSATGTPYWMAPELLRGEGGNTVASDVYSFGIILYEIYARKNPYDGEDYEAVMRDVCDLSINKRPPIPNPMPACVRSMMHDCLRADPEERPSFDEICNRMKRLEAEEVEPKGVKKRVKPGEKNFDLLLKVFPKHIAEALRDGRKVEPENHECVTILFSDIVGFTTISTELEPRKISDMLNRLFLRFDALADDHEVFKVETIGDAWMGVTNCVKDQSSDHVKRIAQYALGMLQAASETLIDMDDPDRGYVQIRVGFHTGPALSNVIGTHNPHYSLFGDTVNTASRMESNSKPGQIHCSERSALLLMHQAPEIRTSSRGKIHVKGKGKMSTYWVLPSGSPQPRLSVLNEEVSQEIGVEGSEPFTVPSQELARENSEASLFMDETIWV